MPDSRRNGSVLGGASRAVPESYGLVDRARRRLRRMIRGGAYVALEEHRSVSDNGVYVDFVERATRDPRVFRSFKRYPEYREVLEHVTERMGRDYLDIVKRDSPDLLASVERFRANDKIGSPVTYAYPETGSISPTTLRYMKVASDIRKYFGAGIGGQVVEIGIGYGGQLLVADRVFSMRCYHLYDLLPVLKLAEKYLEAHILNCAYKASTLNQCAGDLRYDLAISNYAFSELPAGLQEMYVRKILSKSERGYLTMNSGRKTNVYVDDKLSLDDLHDLLPPFEIVEESPATARDNYIIIWGHDTKVA